MKIAFFATGAPWLKPSGGREKRVWEIAKHLAKKHAVYFIYPGYDKPIKSLSQIIMPWYIYGHRDIKDGVYIIYTPSFRTGFHHLDIFLTKLHYLFYAPKIGRLILPKCDVWYCSRAPLGIIFSKARKIADCGRLWIWHWSPITIIDNISNMLGFEYADKCIFNSGENRRKALSIILNKSFGKDIYTINPGIDLKKFKYKKTKKLYDILYVGRREKAKGYHDFIELTKRLPHLKYKMAITEKDMPTIYNQSKILVVPSYGESFSQIVVEALACGIHVISYNTIAKELWPGCYSIVRNRDIKKLSEEINKLLDEKWISIPNVVGIHFAKKFNQKQYLKNIEKEIMQCSSKNSQ